MTEEGPIPNPPLIDVDLSGYTFGAMWLGSEQEGSVSCDRCDDPIVARRNGCVNTWITLEQFTDLATTHEREVHGG